MLPGTALHHGCAPRPTRYAPRATAARRGHALRATATRPRYAPGDSTRVSTAAAFTAFAENTQSVCSPIAQSSV